MNIRLFKYRNIINIIKIIAIIAIVISIISIGIYYSISLFVEGIVEIAKQIEGDINDIENLIIVWGIIKILSANAVGFIVMLFSLTFVELIVGE